ncbi:tetratricopeptide repeat protein [Micromonospora endophytica]|uniref:tetratricopeptide repeat protein n=1 Tax=Micromonospora endophytica TaxID=515350 RepID=UPI002016F397|nr:tetratricopeptide repeat protein [Micromonospora endophytica]
MNNYLASALTKTGSYRRAIDCLNAALAIAQESSNLFETAKIRGNLSVVYWSKGEFEEAAKLGTEALRELPMRYAHRFVIYLPNLGLALTSLGRYAEALRAHRLHLYWANVRGDRYQIANALSHIAGVRVRLGDHRQAVRLLRSAMILFARTGHRYGETDARNTLGIAYRELGLPAQARRQHELALELAGDSAERHAECGVLNDLAHTLAAGGDTEGAIRAHRRAFDLATRIDNRYEQARALAGLAERLLTTDPAEARRHWERALAMFRAMGHPNGTRSSIDWPTPDQARRTYRFLIDTAGSVVMFANGGDPALSDLMRGPAVRCPSHLTAGRRDEGRHCDGGHGDVSPFERSVVPQR